VINHHLEGQERFKEDPSFETLWFLNYKFNFGWITFKIKELAVHFGAKVKSWIQFVV
jgi:hypothetical protein